MSFFRKQFRWMALTAGVSSVPCALSAQQDTEGGAFATELLPLAVEANVGLSDEPALGLAMAVTQLRFAPGVELQSRGYPELQSDFTVRGSTFEQTGLLLGSVPLYDPQTGHYAFELPFAGEMLGTLELYTGVENALSGFNANVASVRYAWAPIRSQGRIVLGMGTDALVFGELYQGQKMGDSGWAWDTSVGHGQGDGTQAGGDFRVWRGAVRLQHQTTRDQTDLAVGWLDKRYGWPGMYTGFASLLETDDYQNLVITANHRSGRSEDAWWEIGGVYREMDDDYYFNRLTPPADRAVQYHHLTRVLAGSAEGRLQLNDSWAVHGRGVVVSDELVRSSTLTQGDFSDRLYGKAAFAVESSWRDGGEGEQRIVVGSSLMATNRDSGRISPLLRWERRTVHGGAESLLFASFAETAQVPGYTALKSAPSGLFGGNADLGRELTRVAEVGWQWEREQAYVRLSGFHRDDSELVDWTYAFASPNARQANAVDLKTSGVEARAVWRASWGEARFGYAWLEKDADYGNAEVDASFYALNFPNHRLTGGVVWRILEGVEVSTEGEYRVAEKNARRTSGREAFLVSLAVRWKPWADRGFEFNALVDNLFDDDFQEFPGSPAVGRHASLRAIHRW